MLPGHDTATVARLFVSELPRIATAPFSTEIAPESAKRPFGASTPVLLAVSVESTIVSDPISFSIPPPAPSLANAETELLSLIVVLVSVSLPALSMPPP